MDRARDSPVSREFHYSSGNGFSLDLPIFCWPELKETSNYLIKAYNMYRGLLVITLILFGVLSVMALVNHGYWGIIEPHFQTFGAGQVLADLLIALSLFLVWLWQDAKQLGRNPWPWIVATLVTGSIAPLLYLITRKPGENIR